MINPETIEDIKKRLVATYQPLEIYLFGSYAWGTTTNESDIDLLVVVESSDEKPHKRGKKASYALWDLQVPKDLLVYTKKEFLGRVNDVGTLCYKIKTEGKLLYARS